MTEISEAIRAAFDGGPEKLPGTLSRRTRESRQPGWKPPKPEKQKSTSSQTEKISPGAILPPDFWHFPSWPADAYAMAALLLERSGAYTMLEPHHIESEHTSGFLKRRTDGGDPDGYEFRWGYVGRFNRDYRDTASSPRQAELRQTHEVPPDNRNALKYAKNHKLDVVNDDKQWVSDQIDPFGVIGENQIELRLAGAMWAFGMTTLVKPIDPPRGAKLPEDNAFLPISARELDRLVTADGVTTDEKIIVATIGRLQDKLNACIDFLDERHDVRCARNWSEVVDTVFAGYSDLCLERLAAIRTRRPDPQYLKDDIHALTLTKMYSSYPNGKRTEVAPTHVSRLYNSLSRFSREYFALPPKERRAFLKIADVKSDARMVRLLTITRWAIDYIQSRWTYLIRTEQEASSSLKHINSSIPPEWCRPAFRLLIAADEASATIGFGTIQGDDADSDPKRKAKPERSTITPYMELYRLQKRREVWGEPDSRDERKQRLARLESNQVSGGASNTKPPYDRTITIKFSDELGAVLPKARAAQVGCTLRSLSHNLAFLPAKGRIRTRWLVPHRRYKRSELKSTIELLLIPYPFAIRSSCFNPIPASQSDASHRTDWGSFEVKQGWLEPLKRHGVLTGKGELHRGLPALIELLAASVQIAKLDGVVFPEFALDADTYCDVSEHLLQNTHAQFIVSGISLRDPNSPADEPALQNSVVLGMDLAEPKPGSENDAEGAPPNDRKSRTTWEIEWARRKHHRWKLDARQLKRYSLAHRLDPGKDWWERLNIRSREIGIAEFHPGSVLTALICEDLARIEPAQVAIRSIGPNLVFVLLMDGPQAPGRWSNQYAGVLADEPGCSVLTMTSMGLINRANAAEGRSDRSFALWRDPTMIEEITLPPGYHAVNITLRAEYVAERTLDGRMDSGKSAVSWRLAGVNPIRLKEEELREKGYSFVEKLPESAPENAGDVKALEESSFKSFLAAYGYEG